MNLKVKKMLMTAVIGGVIGALIISTYFMLLHFAGQNPFGRFKYLYFGFYALSFAGAMWFFREKQNNSVMRGHEGILIGLVHNIAGAVTFALLFGLLLQTSEGEKIRTRHVEQSLKLMTDTKQYLEQSNERVEEYTGERYVQMYKSVAAMSSADFVIDQMIGLLMTGFFLTFLFMLILKKQ
jgi:gas vesicle protein